jgi:hypothetical protein
MSNKRFGKPKHVSDVGAMFTSQHRYFINDYVIEIDGDIYS